MSSTPQKLELRFENVSEGGDFSALVIELSPMNEEKWSETTLSLLIEGKSDEKIHPIWLHLDDLRLWVRKMDTWVEGIAGEFEPMEPAFMIDCKPVGSQFDLVMMLDSGFIEGGDSTDFDRDIRVQVSKGGMSVAASSLRNWING